MKQKYCNVCYEWVSRCDVCGKRIDLYFFGCDQKMEHLMIPLVGNWIKLKASFSYLKYSLSKLKQKPTL